MKSIVSILILSVLFLGIGLAEPSDLSENNSTDSEYVDGSPLLLSSDSGVPDEIKKDPQFIASRGSFSKVSGDYETTDFFSNPVCICWDNVTGKDQFFTEFDDPVIGFSYAGAGYIIVELESDSSEKVNEETIDEIYHVINDYCEQEGVSEVPVVFMWSHIEEDLPLPDYGPQVFEEARKDPLFVAARGTMPVITDASKKVEWTDSLVQCSQSLGNPHSTDTGILPYFVEFGGPVNSFGTNINGYLKVGFQGYSSEKVNESLIDEIYQVIDEQCEQEGISDVPVVFEFIGHIKEAEAEVDEPDVSEVDGANLSDNEEEIAGNETANQTPGFTSIMVILGLLSVLIIKRP
ncbi:TPA: hypothetical protein HA338_14970 [Methanosarcina acetivorans]|nr:hypothetical protein [Methanosarcina acetivorans]HIH95262.1 hypothetical protein [Methanosarcina acetivorans]